MSELSAEKYFHWVTRQKKDLPMLDIREFCSGPWDADFTHNFSYQFLVI